MDIEKKGQRWVVEQLCVGNMSMKEWRMYGQKGKGWYELHDKMDVVEDCMTLTVQSTFDVDHYSVFPR